jgi:hypothetical protein
VSTSIDASSKVFVQAVNDPLTVSLRTMALNTINLQIAATGAAQDDTTATLGIMISDDRSIPRVS